MITVLLFTAFLTPLGAFAVMQARLDLLIEHAARAAVETFTAAETGLDHALADLDLDPSFARLLAGPDGTVGTADDREFPFLHGAPVPLAPPLRYAVTVEPIASDMVDIVSHGHGFGASQRVVAARVMRTEGTELPSALASAGAGVTLTLGAAAHVSGVDRAGRDDPRPALMLGDEGTVARARASLSPAAAERLVGAGGPPSVVVGAAAAVFDRLAAIATDPRAVGVRSAADLDGCVQVSQGSLVLEGDASGSGLLIVEGDLDVRGRFAFAGVMLVRGNIRLDRDSDVRVRGAILQGVSGQRLDLLGAAELGYDSASLVDLAARCPRLLPAGVRITGWRELL